MIHDALRDVFCYVPSYAGLRVGSWLASTVPALARAPVTRAKRKTRSDKGQKRGPRKGPTRTPDSGVVLF